MTLSIAAARLRSRAAQLAAIAATAAVLAGVGVGMAGVLESGLDAAVRGAASDGEAQLVVANAPVDEVAASADAAFGAALVAVEDVAGDAVVRPDAARVGTGDLETLRDAALRMPDQLVEDGVATRTAVSGGMAAWAQELVDLSWRARLLALVPFLVVAVGGAVAARDVVRVLELSRVTELSVTRSRGASRARILLGEVREVAAAGAGGALVGGVAAALLTGAPALLALALAALVPLALAVIAVPVVLGAIPRDRADEASAASGRARAAGAVGLLLVFAATGLSVWRLLSTGSAADPVGVAAPALGLLAGAVLVLAAVGAAARVVDLGTRRWVALGPSLAVRRLARRLPVLATVILLVAVATASTVFASAFAATGDRVAREVRELRVGSDLRATGWPAGEDPETLPADGFSALLATPGEFGDDEPLLLFAAGDRIPDALRPVAGLVDPDGLADAVAVDPVGVALPPGTTRLRIDAAATDGVELRVWVAEPSGRVRSVPLDGDPVEGPAAALLALDADVSRAGGDVSARVTSIVATTPDGDVEVPLPTDWEPQFAVFPDFAGDQVRFDTAVDGLGFDLGRTQRDQVAVRLMPPGAPQERIPVVVSADFAARNDLEPGATIDVRFAGTGRNLLGTVAGVAPAVPAAADRDAVLADLRGFSVQQLRLVESTPDAMELLVRSADSGATRAALPDGVAVTGLEPGTADRMLGIARDLLWLAAAGAVVVAVVGTAGVSASLVAERRRETRILAVLGELPARQARGQRLELALTMALAAIGGLAVGAGLAALLAASFARAAAPGAGVLPAVAVRLDPPGAAIVLGILVVALGAVLAVHGRRIVRDADGSAGVDS